MLKLCGKPFHRDKKHLAAVYECDCGVRFIGSTDSVRAGNTVSCGCKRLERAKTLNRTHGKSKQSLTYTSWQSMRARCAVYSTNAKNYRDRGVTVCERWASFEAFVEDMGERPSKRHSIDRIDVNGHYCPENCRWATKEDQSRNTRRNVLIEYQGKRQCVSDWANELDMCPGTIAHRIKKGWSVDRVLSPRKGRWAHRGHK